MHLGLAALWPSRPEAIPREPQPNRLTAILPYAAAPVALTIVLVRAIRGDTLGPFLMLVGVGAVILVLLRQMIALLDNQALTRGIEAKVLTRTTELRRSEERFRSLVRNSSGVVIILSPDLTIEYATVSKGPPLKGQPARQRLTR